MLPPRLLGEEKYIQNVSDNRLQNEEGKVLNARNLKIATPAKTVQIRLVFDMGNLNIWPNYNISPT